MWLAFILDVYSCVCVYLLNSNFIDYAREFPQDYMPTAGFITFLAKFICKMGMKWFKRAREYVMVMMG